MTGVMFSIVAIVLAIVGVWGVVAIAFALLAGGIIHARDHEDIPYGGLPALPATAAGARVTR